MSALRTWRTFLGVQYAAMLEYRAEILLWAIAMPLPFIMMGLWMEAAVAGGTGGLSPMEVARYFLGVFLVRQLTAVWVVWEMEEEILRGTLSFRLLQPVEPALFHIAGHVAERVVRLPIILALVGLFFALYPESFFVPTLGDALAFALLTLGAFALRFLMQYTFGLMAFWVERAAAIERVWAILFGFLSGLIAPLEVFPPAVASVVSYTPFPYLIHFQARVLMGAEVDVLRGVTVMIAWGLAFYALNRFLWRRGLRHYSGMGA